VDGIAKPSSARANTVDAEATGKGRKIKDRPHERE
jgi:hypothetical protein